MHILPAIDIREGKAVRLFQGDFNQTDIVNEDPLAQALEFKRSGIQMLHIVDLDGAVDGSETNESLIGKIKKETGLKIEVGGGIRTMEQIDRYLQLGIDRIIIGSAALQQPKLVKEAVRKYGEKIAVSIDAKGGTVAIHGWLDISRTNYLQLAKTMAGLGVQTIIYTDITKDGTLNGPTFEDYITILNTLPTIQLIASGGISNKKDLEKLSQLGVHGAIVGKAFYQKAITLDEMLEVEKNVD